MMRSRFNYECTEQTRRQHKIDRQGKPTQLGNEQQKHDNRRRKRNNATGERSAVEILINFRVSIQVSKFADYIIHVQPLILRSDAAAKKIEIPVFDLSKSKLRTQRDQWRIILKNPNPPPRQKLRFFPENDGTIGI